MPKDRDAAAVYDLLVAARTIATGDGDPAGAWVICGGLAGHDDIYTGKQLLVQSGGGKGDMVGITAFSSISGRLDLSPSLKTQSKYGDTLIVLNIVNTTDFTAILTRNQGLAYYGVVTDVPGANQFTIPALSGLGAGKFENVIDNQAYQAFVFRDAAGGGAAPQGESQPISGYSTNTGNFVAAAFSSPVGVGDEMLIIHPFLLALVKLGGVPGTSGNLAGNWNAAETNVCIIGAPNTRYKVHNITIGISALVGNTSIRMYTDVNGSEQRIYPIPANLTFNSTLDAPAIPIVGESFGIKNAIRVTAQSDNPADDGAIIEYDYLIEAM